MSSVERVLLSQDRKWKAEIYRRIDGTFGFRLFNWGPEAAWTLSGRRCNDATLSVDAAEAGVRSRTPELRTASVEA